MSDSPKKRGRPPGSKSKKTKAETKQSVSASSIDISTLSDEQKKALLESLNTQLNIQPLKNPLSRQVRFVKNTFVDNKTQCQEDLAFNKQVKSHVSERARDAMGKKKKCNRCKKDFIAYYTEFLCNTCATNG